MIKSLDLLSRNNKNNSINLNNLNNFKKSYRINRPITQRHSTHAFKPNNMYIPTPPPEKIIRIPPNYRFKRNFVFSSVGDNTNFDNLYISKNMHYDIYVIYYGNNINRFNRYKSKVKYIEKRKGSKFQNLLYFLKKFPKILELYDYFFILDDDIIMNVQDINNMFYLADVYNLTICSPSFKRESKISHSITINKPRALLTYTNFVEVNTPLFNRESLKKLLPYLDPKLIGWGIDFLYMWCNRFNINNKYAIIHAVSCINPQEIHKNNKRELYLISNSTKRKKIWEDYAKKIGCPAYPKSIEYNTLY